MSHSGWRGFLRDIGWHCVFGGLFMVFMTAVLAFVRGDNPKATWQAFAQLYAFEWAYIGIGFFILKRLGEWPPQNPSTGPT